MHFATYSWSSNGTRGLGGKKIVGIAILFFGGGDFLDFFVIFGAILP